MSEPLADALRELVRAVVRDELAALARPEPPVRLLSVDEAAHALGIGRSALYDELRARRLRSCKVGRRRLVPSDAVAEFAAQAAAR